MSSANVPSVSLLVAAYNEGPVIGDIVKGAMAAVPGIEVLVVDDGSTDHTEQAAAAAGARVVRLPVNGGKGAAIRRGLAEIDRDVIVLIDGDAQDDPSEIPALVGALEPGVDLVIGSRFLGRFSEGAITPINRAGNQFLTGVINLLFGVRLTDTQAGFKALRRAALGRIQLTARYFDIEVDLLLGVLLAGGRVIEIPVRRDARPHGKSRLKSFLDGSRILRRILKRRLGRP